MFNPKKNLEKIKKFTYELSSLVMPRDILVVEDDETTLSYLDLVLKKAGHNVTLAKSGREALSKLNNDKEEIDTVIIDYVMPEMSGVELLERIRDLHIQKFVMTGYLLDYLKEMGTINKILDLGATIVEKPFNIHYLETGKEYGKF